MDPVSNVSSNDSSVASTSWSASSAHDDAPQCIEPGPSTSAPAPDLDSWLGDDGMDVPFESADDLFTPRRATSSGEAPVADKPLSSVSASLERSVMQKSVETVATNSVVGHLERRAADRFAKFGEEGVLHAARDLQMGRILTDRVSRGFSVGQTVVGLEKERLQTVREHAKAGNLEEANRHTWGTAARSLVDGAFDLLGKPAKLVGAGDVLKEVAKRTGISAGAEALGRGFGDAIWEFEVESAVKVAEATGWPLREGVMEEWQRIQARRAAE